MKTNPETPPNPTGAPAQATAPARAAPAICSATHPCRIEGWTLRIPPLSILRAGLRYANPAELAIDLREVGAGRYRVIAVHNFHVEDRNPQLDECVAGVFLAAARRDGTWEEPERFPIECRSIAMLAEIDVPRDAAAEGAS